jgi:DNA-binding GntR family transcriptional regulator
MKWSRYNQAKTHRIANDLELLIRQGVYKKDDTLPHAHVLRRIYGVSDPCLVRVRQILAQKGLVKAVKGKGTFVL